MTPPPPGTEPAISGSHALGDSVRENEWRNWFRQLSALHEADRRTAARALHNQIGQAVSAIKMSAHLTLDEADAAQRREDLLEIIRIADDTVAQLRDLHALLHPPQLDSLGLEAALRSETESVSAASAVGVTADIGALPLRPDAEIELTGFRIVQQLLRRMLTAAPRASVFLQLRDDGDGLSLRLECDDRDAAALGALGAGASLLREWATALGGDLGIAFPDTGIRFELRLPYTPPGAAAYVRASAL